MSLTLKTVRLNNAMKLCITIMLLLHIIIQKFIYNEDDANDVI